jgi:cobalt-zinc-cadmium efflux system outer membrane protein
MSAELMSARAFSMALGLALFVVASKSRALDTLPSPLRAEDVVTWAKTHRAEIAAARAKSAALAETPKVVSALPDPMVMVSLDHLPFKLMGADASLMVQQDFPLSGVLGKKKASAEANAKASFADSDAIALDVQASALNAYLMVVELERMSAVLDEQAITARTIVEATLVRLETGSGNAAEVVRARLDVVRLEGEKKAVEAELVGARSMLNATLARPLDAAIPKTALAVPTADPPGNDKLVAIALDKRPELLAMRYRAEKATADIGVMSSMYSPMAFVRTGPSYTMTDGPGVMLMIGVSVPIWREKLSAGVAEAKGMALMVDNETAAMKKMIEGEVASARSSVIAAKIRFELNRDKIVPIAKQSITLTLQTYAGGHAPLVAVLDALQMQRMARMEEVVSEVRLAIAWTRLGRAVGVVRVGVP